MKSITIIQKPEIWAFALMLLLANLTLLVGQVCEPLTFYPAKVAGGDWWRVLTFSFVHVSWYHLLLDAGAFLLLYHGLLETSARRRLLLVIACTTGSLCASLIASPLTGGLCGLSGIAHGLMAVSALETIKSRDRTLRTAGVIIFITVVLKSIYEGLTGHIAFNCLHLGPIGNAVPICHTGGVLGGIFSYMTLTILTHRKQKNKINA